MNEVFLHDFSIFSSESSDLLNSNHQNCWQCIKFVKIMNIKSESLELSESIKYKSHSSLSHVICQSAMISCTRRFWASSKASQKSMSESFKDSNKFIIIKSANKNKKSAEFSIQSESSTHESSNNYLMMTRKYWDYVMDMALSRLLVSPDYSPCAGQIYISVRSSIALRKSIFFTPIFYHAYMLL